MDPREACLVHKLAEEGRDVRPDEGLKELRAAEGEGGGAVRDAIKARAKVDAVCELTRTVALTSRSTTTIDGSSGSSQPTM
jgi:hypothetical protein